MKLLRHLLLLAAVSCNASCIENTLPYPVVPIDILGISGEGFTVTGSDIDAAARIVTLHLDETTDISRVRIDSVRITDGGRASMPLVGTFDLRNPIHVTLSLYQDYLWEIRAEQTIERIFEVEGQIGASEIDAAQRTATARVGLDTDLGAIRITQLKLGPRDITTLDPAPEELTDFTSVRYVEVSYHDFRERWRLYVEHTDESVAIASADLWSHTGTLSIAPQSAAEVALEYRRAGAEAWQRAEVTRTGTGALTAAIAPVWNESTNAGGYTVYRADPATGLFAGTTYEYRLLLDGAEGPSGSFVTEAGGTIPRGDMEDPAMSCFTTENTASVDWGSGNNTFTRGLCTQSTFAGMQGEHCARLASTTAVGILAAGNLFTGCFYKADLTTGVVEFGQPYDWKARPSALRVKYYAETLGKVDIDRHDGAPIGMGDRDRARIFVAIVDWNARHAVASGTAAPTGMWDPERQDATDEGRIIGYGSLFIDTPSEGGTMLDVAIPLYFYDREVRPAGPYTLAISCAANAYGDYMVGCQSNVLYLDDFRWEY